MRRFGSATLTLWALAACGSSSVAAPPRPDDPVTIKQGELTRLRDEAARVGPLQDRLAALQRERDEALAALHVANQRLGLEPFAPTSLARVDFAVKLPDASRLDARTAKPKRTTLSKVLGDTQRGLVIAYWATWCKPCTSEEELQRLARLRGELATQGADLVFLAVDGLDKVVADPRAERWLYPLWQRDQAHLDMLPESFVRADGVDLPLMLVVPKDGRVRWIRKGALDDDAARDLVTAVIRGR
ncbi:MAG: redoxin domain-containing protein [Myxococcota bacterium]